ncbi:MAG: TSUP family transporter [Desulfobacterales bacterium]|nr:TSUP family transporter [Desulfobacterales bacterium]
MKKLKLSLKFVLILLFIGAYSAFGDIPDKALMDLQENINQAISRVKPSVITVKAQKKSPQDLGNNFIWYESIGSGIIVDEKGFAITNFHVVEDSFEVYVLLGHNQNKIPARIIDSDKALDLAILKIDANENFHPVFFGDSDKLQIGDLAICVGSPFGFKDSVSMGIISDVHRTINVNGISFEGMIQTDAVINQGNSGGPLIDISGKVIGIGTAIYAPDGTYTGIGFAIPIKRAIHFFSRFTGAVQVAFTLPNQGAAKEPINLNKRMPNDATHQSFSNCLECHTISQKMVVSLKANMPHEPVGVCDECHIFVNDPVITKGSIPVAAVSPLYQKSIKELTYFELFKGVIIKIALFLLIGTILFTMLGVGGGFMYVPVLLACGIDFHTASTTSLFLITCSQLLASIIYFNYGFLDLKLMIVLEIPTMIGAFIGGIFSSHFNVTFLAIMFAFMLLMACYFMLQDTSKLENYRRVIKNKNTPWQWKHEFMGKVYTIDMLLAVSLTFTVGFIGGILGVAGGWLKVPMLVVLFNIPMKIAIGTSSLMVPITSFTGLLGHSIVGHFDYRLGLSLAIFTIIGAQIGARVAIETKSNLLKMIFSFIMSLVALWMIFNAF